MSIRPAAFDSRVRKGGNMIRKACRVLCPICSSLADPVLTNAEVFVKRTSTKKVGAKLVAFQCNAASHVFFIRSEDLGNALPQQLTTDPGDKKEAVGAQALTRGSTSKAPGKQQLSC
jgi:hypothetical protein